MMSAAAIDSQTFKKNRIYFVHNMIMIALTFGIGLLTPPVD